MTCICKSVIMFRLPWCQLFLFVVFLVAFVILCQLFIISFFLINSMSIFETAKSKCLCHEWMHCQHSVDAGSVFALTFASFVAELHLLMEIHPALAVRWDACSMCHLLHLVMCEFTPVQDSKHLVNTWLVEYRVSSPGLGSICLAILSNSTSWGLPSHAPGILSRDANTESTWMGTTSFCLWCTGGIRSLCSCVSCTDRLHCALVTFRDFACAGVTQRDLVVHKLHT